MKTNHTKKAKTNHKLQEALELLNEAASEKKGELYDLIGDKYDHFKEILSDTALTGKSVFSQTRKEFVEALQDGEEKIVNRAKQIDKQVHTNPWMYVGIVAMSSVLFGYFMRHKK